VILASIAHGDGSPSRPRSHIPRPLEALRSGRNRGLRQRFILLRATAALRVAHGKTVTVTRDAKGRLLVRPDPDKDIGLWR
jgi:YD repeat-containing protein